MTPLDIILGIAAIAIIIVVVVISMKSKTVATSTVASCTTNGTFRIWVETNDGRKRYLSINEETGFVDLTSNPMVWVNRRWLRPQDKSDEWGISVDGFTNMIWVDTPYPHNTGFNGIVFNIDCTGKAALVADLVNPQRRGTQLVVADDTLGAWQHLKLVPYATRYDWQYEQVS